MNDGQQVPQGVDPGRPSPARMYDCYLGGTANFPADRDAVARIVELVPEIRDAAWANRGFLQRAVRWMAERGIRQFIDLGAGLPTQRCTHEVAREVDPGAVVVYTDSDPGVIAHGRRDPGRGTGHRGDRSRLPPARGSCWTTRIPGG